MSTPVAAKTAAAGTITSASAGRSPIVASTGTRRCDDFHDIADSLGVERAESARGGVFAVNDVGSAAKRHVGLGGSHTGLKGRPVSSQTFDHSVIRGGPRFKWRRKVILLGKHRGAVTPFGIVEVHDRVLATLASPGARRKMRVPS